MFNIKLYQIYYVLFITNKHNSISMELDIKKNINKIKISTNGLKTNDNLNTIKKIIILHKKNDKSKVMYKADNKYKNLKVVNCNSINKTNTNSSNKFSKNNCNFYKTKKFANFVNFIKTNTNYNNVKLEFNTIDKCKNYISSNNVDSLCDSKIYNLSLESKNNIAIKTKKLRKHNFKWCNLSNKKSFILSNINKNKDENLYNNNIHDKYENYESIESNTNKKYYNIDSNRNAVLTKEFEEKIDLLPNKIIIYSNYNNYIKKSIASKIHKNLANSNSYKKFEDKNIITNKNNTANLNNFDYCEDKPINLSSNKNISFNCLNIISHNANNIGKYGFKGNKIKQKDCNIVKSKIKLLPVNNAYITKLKSNSSIKLTNNC